jgi:hypothetical protein
VVGLDFEYGDFRPGLHIIGDLASGEAVATGAHCLSGATPISCIVTGTGRNTGNIRPGTPDSAFVTFRSLHLVAGWRMAYDDPAGTRLIKMIEPALRLDATDPNSDRADDGGLLITPVINVYFSQTTVMRAGLDLYRYTDAAGTSRSVRALRVSWQSNF